jgi:hypothetical protein
MAVINPQGAVVINLRGVVAISQAAAVEAVAEVELANLR